MPENLRHFTVGPDPFGRTWEVQFLWLQTAISIRHSDSVDVKWRLITESETQHKVIALWHPELLRMCQEHNRALTDPWCMKLAAAHLRTMILTAEDMEKTLVTPSRSELEAAQVQISRELAAR